MASFRSMGRIVLKNTKKEEKLLQNSRVKARNSFHWGTIDREKNTRGGKGIVLGPGKKLGGKDSGQQKWPQKHAQIRNGKSELLFPRKGS